MPATDKYCADVFGVIVTYNPDLPALDALLNALLPQIGAAIVVDNGSQADMNAWFDRWRGSKLRLHLMGTNAGIATAQNVGIDVARRTGAHFILLSDQDSKPADNMTWELRRAAEQLLSGGASLAAVGPRYLDSRQQNPPPFIQLKGLRLERQWCERPDDVVKVDYLIASGCLIPAATLSAVGGMHEALFIDYVDIEWGLRAKQRGYQSYGVCAAMMEHSLGDAPIRFMGNHYPSHSPLRHYYHFRNAVWLYQQRFIPFNWKLADCLRLIRKYVFYSLFAKPQLAHLRMMTVGIFHGMRSRLGRI